MADLRIAITPTIRTGSRATRLGRHEEDLRVFNPQFSPQFSTGACPQCGSSHGSMPGGSSQGWMGTYPGGYCGQQSYPGYWGQQFGPSWSWGGGPFTYPTQPYNWMGTYSPGQQFWNPGFGYQGFQPGFGYQGFHPGMMGGFGGYQGFQPGMMGGFGGFEGFQPGIHGGFGYPGMGWGLGGLRQWGGSYTPQYTTTGLPTDEEITEMIYDAIDADPLVPWDADINVDVDAGTVTLAGTVPNKRIKHAAGDDAWWISGVVNVHNNLDVSGRRRVRGGEAQEGQPQQQSTTGGAATRRRTGQQ